MHVYVFNSTKLGLLLVRRSCDEGRGQNPHRAAPFKVEHVWFLFGNYFNVFLNLCFQHFIEEMQIEMISN